ncbi:N-acetyltransferase [Microbulbifer sp. PSTR4-B]|uniref:N-acetyltransferase n=1 Tax=Microbulbifer sp. PSTR4-B TaxID=3243396 RepID=UPI004039B70F
MKAIEYLKFSEVNPHKFLPILNGHKTRKHLIEHKMFTLKTVTEWMHSKIEVDKEAGCRVRAIIVDDELAGWCGIQQECGKYEIAIVIDGQFWGVGRIVFQDLMRWARELNHDEVLVNFHHTRPIYKFLEKIAEDIHESEIYGSKFTTYKIKLK